MEDYQSLVAALSENVLTINMLLSVFFLPGIYTHSCGKAKAIVSITTPTQFKALSGSCLEVPCSFTAESGSTVFDSRIETSGVWIKSDKYLFHFSNGVNTYPIEITGNLSQKKCTTLFSDLTTSQEVKYFLRIENGRYKGTACSSPLQITVEDSPWSPSINIPADLKEHQSVTISCSALTPCPHSPPELTWSLQQDSHRQTEKNTEGIFTTKIQETITLSDTHDGYNISCSATYTANGESKTAKTEVTLSVSYAPKDTSASISPSGLVSAGSWVELSCSSRAKPPASFTWFRNSTHGAIKVSVGQVYSFNATEGGEYYCEATNDLGHQSSSVILGSTEGAETFQYLIPLLAVIVVIVLICLVISVWWFKFKHLTPQQTQSETGVEVQLAANKAEEELNYGEVNFQQRGHEASSVSVQDGGQQDTVYAQVKVSPDCPEDVYAQVKKK